MSPVYRAYIEMDIRISGYQDIKTIITSRFFCIPKVTKPRPRLPEKCITACMY